MISSTTPAAMPDCNDSATSEPVVLYGLTWSLSETTRVLAVSIGAVIALCVGVRARGLVTHTSHDAYLTAEEISDSI